MNRRGFLSKICALLPFGAGLSLTGQSGASEGQRKGNLPKGWTKTEEIVPWSSIGTSSDAVNCMIHINYWDKDEPDIYTLEDGEPVRS